MPFWSRPPPLPLHPFSNFSQAAASSTGVSNPDTTFTTLASTSTSISTILTPYKASTTMEYTGTASAAHSQSPYPSSSSCTGPSCVENVNCVQYCSSDNESQSCGSGCLGGCTTPPAADCKSATMWPEVHDISIDDPGWHYSVCYLPPFSQAHSVRNIRRKSGGRLSEE